MNQCGGGEGADGAMADLVTMYLSDLVEAMMQLVYKDEDKDDNKVVASSGAYSNDVDTPVFVEQMPNQCVELSITNEAKPSIAANLEMTNILEWPNQSEEELTNRTGPTLSIQQSPKNPLSSDRLMKEEPRKKNHHKVPQKIAIMNSVVQKPVQEKSKAISDKNNPKHLKNSMVSTNGSRKSQIIARGTLKMSAELQECEKVRVASKFVMSLAFKSRDSLLPPAVKKEANQKVKEIRERAIEIRKARADVNRASSQAIQALKTNFDEKKRKISEDIAKRELKNTQIAYLALQSRREPYDPQAMVFLIDQPSKNAR